MNSPCTDSCTTVQGRFTTGTNEPVAGVSLEIRSEIKPTLGLGQTTIRKIANGKTDNNGFYSFTFLLKKGEFGEYQQNLYLKIGYESPKFLPVSWYDQYGTEEIIPVLKEKKDTTVIMDYYLASKAQLRLKLANFTPVNATDSFYILPLYHQVGYDKKKVTEPQFFSATQLVNEKLIAIAGNIQNKISVVRNKNGVRTVTDTLVFTPTNQITPITFNY